METINDFILTFLVNCLWQTPIVTIIAAVGNWLLRRAHAQFHHALWVAALILCVGLPLCSLLQKPEKQNFNFSSLPQIAAVQNTPGGASRVGWNFLRSQILLEEQNFFGLSFPALTVALVTLYLMYLLFRVFRIGKAWRETGRIRRAASKRELTPAVKSAVSRCQSVFGTRFEVLFSPDVAAPVVTGVFCPTILLPDDLFETTLDETLATAAVGHETAHIKRHDFAFNLIYEILYLPISFHPAMRVVRQRIAKTREMACDEMVAERLLGNGAYARSLVQLAALLTQPPKATAALAVGMTSGDILEMRVRRLVAEQRRISNWKAKLLLTLAAFLLAAAGGIASVFSLNFVSVENKKTISNAQDVAGVWQGDFKGLPGVTLLVKPKGNEIDGNITFYPLKKTPTGLKVVGSTGELPLIKPKLNGNSLSFKIKRAASDDIVQAEMNLVGENEAVLKLESKEIKNTRNETKMTRIIAVSNGGMTTASNDDISTANNDDTSTASNDDTNINISQTDEKHLENRYEKKIGRREEKNLERKIKKDWWQSAERDTNNNAQREH